MSDFISETAANPATFTEWLFFTVPKQEGAEDDIVKKFAAANQSRLGWPTQALSLDEFIIFFAELSIAAVTQTTLELTRTMLNKDFDDYLRLLRARTAQIEAAYKSNQFALRTAWKDYEAYINSTQQ